MEVLFAVWLQMEIIVSDVSGCLSRHTTAAFVSTLLHRALVAVVQGARERIHLLFQGGFCLDHILNEDLFFVVELIIRLVELIAEIGDKVIDLALVFGQEGCSIPVNTANRTGYSWVRHIRIPHMLEMPRKVITHLNIQPVKVRINERVKLLLQQPLHLLRRGHLLMPGDVVELLVQRQNFLDFVGQCAVVLEGSGSGDVFHLRVEVFLLDEDTFFLAEVVDHLGQSLFNQELFLFQVLDQLVNGVGQFALSKGEQLAQVIDLGKGCSGVGLRNL